MEIPKIYFAISTKINITDFDSFGQFEKKIEQDPTWALCADSIGYVYFIIANSFETLVDSLIIYHNDYGDNASMDDYILIEGQPFWDSTSDFLDCLSARLYRGSYNMRNRQLVKITKMIPMSTWSNFI